MSASGAVRRWFAEPYRLFFPLGILLGWAGVGHWLAYGAGWSAEYSGYYHACLQGWLFAGAFVGGFLATAVPRMTGTVPASAAESLILAGWMAATLVALTFGSWSASAWGQLGFLFTLGAFIVRRALSRRSGTGAEPPRELVWIPAALVSAAAGLILILRGRSADAPALILGGRALAEQGFLLCLVMGVGGFLAPRLMGTVVERPARLRTAVHLISMVLLGVSFYWEVRRWLVPAYALRGLVVTVNTWMTGSLVIGRPRQPGALAKLLWVSFWMVSAGPWLAAVFPAQRPLMLHFLFIGGFSLMIYSVATMVVLSHAGEGSSVYRPLWIYQVIAAGHAVALGLRLAAGYLPERYFTVLAAASAAWIAMGAAWLAFACPYLFRLPAPGVVEAQHEEFRRQARHAC